MFRTLTLIFALLVTTSASAAESLGYSGRLVQADGSPVTGPVTLRFEIAYTDDTSTVVCTKDVAGIALTSGVFHARLSYTTAQCGGDSLTTVLAAAPTGETSAMRVTDVTNSKAYDWQALHAVPYALNASGLDRLGAATGQVLKWDGSAWLPGNDGVGTGGVINGSAGDATAPGISFSSDTDTGFYAAAANQIGVAAGGAQLFAFDVNGFFSPITGGGSVASAAGTEALPTFAFAGDLDTGWFRPAANTIAASTGGSERLRVDSAGDLGVGTTNPLAPLDVSSGETITALFGADASAKTRTDATAKQASLGAPHYTNAEEPMALIYANSASGDNQLYVGGGTANMNAATAIRFNTAANQNTTTGTVRMAIGSNGNVGIGVDPGTAVLHLKAGTATAGTAPLKLTSGTVLTTPEDGALEFDGSVLYFTTGVTRYIVPFAAAAGSLTNVTNLSNSTGNITITPAAGTGSVILTGAASTGTSSGALIVSGGVGVSGTINSVGNITSDGIITAVTSMFTPQLYGSTASGGDILIDGTSHATKGDVLLATAGGNVGVGTASPAGKFSIVGGSDVVQLALRGHTTQTTKLQEWQRGSDGLALSSMDSLGRLTLFQGAAASGNNSIISYASSDNFNSASNVYGVYGTAVNSGLGRVYGVNSFIETRGAGTVSDGVGVGGGVRTNNAGTTLTNAKALEAFAPVRTAGAITNAYGVYVNAQSGTGISNSYGVYSAGSSDTNYFAGKVGIGTTAPSFPFDVNSASTDVARFESTSTYNYIRYANSGGTPYVWAQSVGPTGYQIYDETAGATRLTVLPSGNVGIGTTSPGSKLDVKGGQLWAHSTDNNVSRQDNLHLGELADSPTTPLYVVATKDADDGLYFISQRYNSIVNWSRQSGTGEHNAMNLASNTGGLTRLDLYHDDTDTVKVSLSTGGDTYFNGGDVGIGTATPGAKLDAQGSPGSPATSGTAQNGVFRIGATGGNGLDVGVLSGAPYTTWMQSGYLYDYALSAYYPLSLNPLGGNVGIGTTAPSAALEVVGTVKATAFIGPMSSTSASLGSGTVGTPSINFTGDTDTGIFNPASDTLAFSTAGTEKFRIEANGNVGVGTSGSLARIAVVTNPASSADRVRAFSSLNTANNTLQIDHFGSTHAALASWTTIGVTNSEQGIGLVTDDQAAVDAGTSRKGLFVKSGGNVGIGTMAPGSKLEVYGTAQTTAALTDAGSRDALLSLNSNNAAAGNGGGITFGNSQSIAAGSIGFAAIKGLLTDGSANTVGDLAFATRNLTSDTALTERMRILSSGNVGIGVTNPTVRLVVGVDNPGVITEGQVASFFSGVDTAVSVLSNTNNAGQGSRLRLFENNPNKYGTELFYDSGANSFAIVNYSNNYESGRIHMDQTGNVGIGATAPQSKLEVNLVSSDVSALMNANQVNDELLIRAPYSAVPTGGANAGAKWGLRFVGRSDGAYDNYKSGAIYGVSEDTGAGYNRQVGLAFHTTSFDAVHSERMRIDGNGNVGIGTTGPLSVLHVQSAAPERIYLKANTGASAPSLGATLELESNIDARGRGMYLTTTDQAANSAWFAGVPYQGAGFQIGVSSVHNYQAGSSSAYYENAKLFISTSGNVGIGTTNPSVAKLQVAGQSGVWAGYFAGNSAASNSYGVLIDAGTNTSDSPLRIRAYSGSDILYVRGDGNVGIGTVSPTEKLEVNGNVLATAHTTPSDRRLKKDIQPIPHALEKILALRGVSYRWRAGLNKDDGRHLGVVAQEVQKVLPEAVHPNDEGILRVDYPSLIAPVIAAIKQLYGRLTADEVRVRVLHEKVGRLERQNALLEERLRRLEARPIH